MKRKELAEYIRQQVINELTPAELNAKKIKTDNANKAIAKLTQKLGIEKDPNVKKEVQADLIVAKEKLATANAIKELSIDEMARKASPVKIQDKSKFDLAKEIYTSGKIAKMLAAIEDAGEEGTTKGQLGIALGLKSDAELSPLIRALASTGAISAKIEKAEEPEIEEPVSTEEPDEWEMEPETDAEEPDEWETPEEPEEAPEEKPEAPSGRETELGKNVEKLAQLKVKKDDLVKKLKNKEITMDQYKEMIGTIPQQIKDLEAKLDNM